MAAADLVRTTKKCKEDYPLEKHITHIKHPEKAIKFGSNLSAEIKAQLIVLLTRFAGIFAWQPTYMTGVDRRIIEVNHSILPGSAPIKQKRKGQVSDRNKVINEEVSKLVAVGIH